MMGFQGKSKTRVCLPQVTTCPAVLGTLCRVHHSLAARNVLEQQSRLMEYAVLLDLDSTQKYKERALKHGWRFRDYGGASNCYFTQSGFGYYNECTQNSQHLVLDHASQGWQSS